MAGPNEYEIVGTGDTADLNDALKTSADALKDTAGAAKDAEGAVGKLGDTMDEASVPTNRMAAAVAKLRDGLGGSTEGLEANTGALQENADVTNESADSTERSVGAIRAQILALKEENALLIETAERLAIMKDEQAAAALSMDAFDANASVMYGSLTTLSAMGTPAILKAATWGTLLAGGAAYEGIKQYMEFQKSITQTVTQAGVSPKWLPFLTGTAEKVTQLTGVNLDDVANDIYRVASGTASWNHGLGATKSQLAAIVKQTAQLQVLGNVAGGATSEQTARVMTAMVNANMRGVGHDPKLAAELVNAAIGAGDIRMSDLVPALGRGLMTSAKSNNLSAHDALTWLDLLTSLGTTGSVAGNYVKTGINLLANPSAQGAGALAMLGIKPGEIEGMLGSKGGLLEAVNTMRMAFKKFNPSAALTLYRNAEGVPYAGDEGKVAAIRKLETWAVGELPKSFVDKWEKGELTAKQQTYATDLILTKAFGGSKQFATIAALINNPNLLTGISNRITANENSSVYNRDVARALNTPSQQLHKILGNLQVDFVNIGKALTPAFLGLAHVVMETVGFFTRFKALGESLLWVLAEIVAMAGISKIAKLGLSAASLIGGTMTHMGMEPTGIFKQAYNENAIQAKKFAGQALIEADETLGAQLKANALQQEENTNQIMRLNAILLGEGPEVGRTMGMSPMGGGVVGGAETGTQEDAGVLAFRRDLAGRATPLSSPYAFVGNAGAAGVGGSAEELEQNAAFLTALRAGKSGATAAEDLGTSVAETGVETGVTDASSLFKLAPLSPELEGLLGGTAAATGGMSMLPMMALMMVPALMPALISVGQKLMGLFTQKYIHYGAGSVGNIATLQSTTTEIGALEKQLKGYGTINEADMSLKQLETLYQIRDKLAQQLDLQKEEKKDPGLAYRHAIDVASNAGVKAAVAAVHKGTFLDPTMLLSSSRYGIKEVLGLTPFEAARQDIDTLRKAGLTSQYGSSVYSVLDTVLKGKGTIDGKKYTGGISTENLQNIIESRVNQIEDKAQARVAAYNHLSLQQQNTYIKGLGNLNQTRGALAEQYSTPGFKSLFSGKGPLKVQLQSAEGYRATLLKEAANDFAMAHSGKLSEAQDKAEMDTYAKEELMAKSLGDLVTYLKTERKPMLLDTQSINDWVAAMNAKDAALAPQEAALIGSAVATALKSNPKALANIVNAGNTSKHNRG